MPKKGMALTLAPRDLRLFLSNAAHDKTPIIPRHLRTSRQPVRNHFTLKRYRIDSRYRHRTRRIAVNIAKLPELLRKP